MANQSKAQPKARENADKQAATGLALHLIDW